MIRNKLFALFFFSLFLLKSPSLFSIDFEVDAFMGFWEDEMVLSSKGHDSNTPLFIDHLKTKTTGTQEIGLKARASFLGLTAKGYASYGRVCSGKYRELLFEEDVGRLRTRAEIGKGHSQEAS